MDYTYQIDSLIQRFPQLSICRREIQSSIEKLIECYNCGNKLLVCGNGGSAADAQHIVGELMKSFQLKREPVISEREKIQRLWHGEAEDISAHLQRAFPAISLTGEDALCSAFANDVDADYIYAQQVFGLGKPGDVLMGISTSGNSGNVVLAAKVAKAQGMTVISLTGMSGGRLNAIADILIPVPEVETYRVQELHLPVYHAICAAVEAAIFK